MARGPIPKVSLVSKFGDMIWPQAWLMADKAKITPRVKKDIFSA
jgi:hypothetical protein